MHVCESLHMRPFLNPRRPPPLVSLLLLLKPHLVRRHPTVTAAGTVVAQPLAEMAKTVEESGVGISCFVSSLPGFRGVLKQRYSDFIVNEVGLDGQVVHLTSLDIPEDLEDRNDKKVDTKEVESSSERKDYTLDLAAFRTLCGDADAEALGSLLQRISSNESDIMPIVLSSDSDKSHRGEVHNFFKNHFKFLVTDTVEESENGAKSVRVRFTGDGEVRGKQGRKRKDRKGDRPFDSRGSENWPEGRGKFLRFNLYKENKDTQEALGVIGKMLGFQQRSFGFAGTKDKRAITTQRVTIFKLCAKKLALLNSRLFGIKVGDFCYVNEGLVLGQLLGNRFTITLRDVIADSKGIIKEAADGLGSSGFINYYGLQRFGSGSVPTHLIGAALLRGEWKAAASLILDPREGERENIREARQHYKENGDIDLALRKFPRYLVAERAILQYLKKCPGNYLQALQSVPRTLRMMYVHSYQSYLWNHAASMRVQKYGISQVVLGDLVFCKQGCYAKPESTNNSEPEDNCLPDVDNCLSELSNEALPEENVQFVKVVDPDDLLKDVYTFEDVVLPLPGSTIMYPENDVSNVYHDMAKKDGINLTESIHGAKDFSITNMKGGYRRVFQRPIDFTWELLTYAEDTIPLAETDLDIINKRCHTVTKEEVLVGSRVNTEQMNVDGSVGEYLVENRSEDTSSNVEYLCSSVSKSPKLALKLGFTLPSSCYATMAIRELLKTSTSVSYQKTLNS